MNIQIKNLTHIYLKGTPLEKLALDNVSTSFDSGKITAILGETGSGKSTLLQHLNGILQPTSGEIIINNKPISDYKKSEIRQKVGIVFQFPETQLFEETLFDDIAFGPRNLKMEEKIVEKQVFNALDMIAPELKNKLTQSPFSLSGGEKRKAAICGIIAMNPQILVLDEPAAGLDPKSKIILFSTLLKLHKNQKMGIIFITHDINDAINYADQIIVMKDGKIILDISQKKLIENIALLTEKKIELPDKYKIMASLSDKIEFAKPDISEENLLKKIKSKITAR